MAVDRPYAKAEYTIQSGVYDFPIPWSYTDSADVKLYIVVDRIRTLVPSSSYNIIIGETHIVRVAATTINQNIGSILSIERETPRQQNLVLFPKAPISPVTLEGQLDTMERQIQELDANALTEEDGIMLSEALEAETAARIAADNAEAAARIAADNAEAAARIAADNALNLRVDNEVAAREAADTALTAGLNSKLSLSGGTMSGPINMGSNKLTGVPGPTDSSDAVDYETVRALSAKVDAIKNARLLGNVDTHADLPWTVAAAVALGWPIPNIGDYCNVLADETFNGARVEWYVTAITGGGLTWGDPIELNQGDFQRPSTVADAGRVLTGGTTGGTFGASLGVDTAPTSGSSNLITSGSVLDAINYANQLAVMKTGDAMTGPLGFLMPEAKVLLDLWPPSTPIYTLGLENGYMRYNSGFGHRWQLTTIDNDITSAYRAMELANNNYLYISPDVVGQDAGIRLGNGGLKLAQRADGVGLINASGPWLSFGANESSVPIEILAISPEYMRLDRYNEETQLKLDLGGASIFEQSKSAGAGLGLMSGSSTIEGWTDSRTQLQYVFRLSHGDLTVLSRYENSRYLSDFRLGSFSGGMSTDDGLTNIVGPTGTNKSLYGIVFYADSYVDHTRHTIGSWNNFDLYVSRDHGATQVGVMTRIDALEARIAALGG